MSLESLKINRINNPLGYADFCKSSLPINLFVTILRMIVPAKAMRESVSSNWRVFLFGGQNE